MNTPLSPPIPSGFAAVFLDFENVYYFLKNTFFDPPELNDHILELLRNLRQKLSADYSLDSIVLNAYADFERLDSSPQSALYLLGVDTKNVLGTDHKNAADMRLCIDVLEVLYTRAEISTFVLVAGDRDYIPVIQHLRRQARRVLGVGFRESVSGDLLQNLGENQFIDARELLNPATLERLETRRQEQQKAARRTRKTFRRSSSRNRRTRAQCAQPKSAPVADKNGAKPGATNSQSSGGNNIQNDSWSGGYEEKALARCAVARASATVRRSLARSRRQRDRMPENYFAAHSSARTKLWHARTVARPIFASTDRRNADVSRIRAPQRARRFGACRSDTFVEKREGDPHPFSVLLVNYQHPDVWELNP